ncbi:MAG: hypothetical protein FH753_18095 [Firmicutes bacterium]|nr:hypothetical protein [Bacillota bacterium]
MKIINNKNLTMKIVALFFAIILWSYVMSEVNPKVTKVISNVDVKLLNEESLNTTNLQLMDAEDLEVTVKIEGRRNEIYDINNKDIKAKADIRGYQEGEHKVPVKIEASFKDDKIVDYYPKEVLMKFESIIEKQYPVTIKTKGNIKKGYTKGKIKLKPDTVMLRGPRSVVNSVKDVIATINVEDAKKDIKTSVPFTILNGSDKEIGSLESKPEFVNVEVDILKLKEVKVEAKIKGKPLPGFKITDISLKPNKIFIEGYEDKLKDINSIDTKSIEVNYFSDNFSKEVELIAPKGINIHNNKKTVVDIKVEKIIEKEFEYDSEDVVIKNLKSGYKIDKTDTDNSIKVSIKGIESLIKNVNKEDIIPFIDLKDIKEGTQLVEIKIEKPKDIELSKINPENMELTIIKSELDENNTKGESETTDN